MNHPSSGIPRDLRQPDAIQAHQQPFDFASIMNQTVQIDEFANAFQRCLHEGSGSAIATGSNFLPMVNTTPAEVTYEYIPHVFWTAPAVHHAQHPPAQAVPPSGSSALRRILEAPTQASWPAGAQACDIGVSTSDVRTRNQSGSDLPTDIPATTSRESVSLSDKRSSGEAEEGSLEEYTQDAWIEAFTQQQASFFGGSDAFLALWPEYAGMEFAFLEKRDLYKELKSEVELRSNDTSAEDSALRARIRSAKLDFRRAIRRIDRFVALARLMPTQLRQMLDRKDTLNEVFLRLSLPAEEPSGLLRHVLFDSDEGRIGHGEIRRETSMYFAKVLVDWPVDAAPVVEYRCLFDGCTFTSCWRKNMSGQHLDYLRMHLKNCHAFSPVAKRSSNKEVQPGPLQLARAQLDATVTAIVLHIPIAPGADTHPPLAAVVTTSDSDGVVSQSTLAPVMCIPASFVGGGDLTSVEDDDDIVFLEEVKTVGQGCAHATPHASIGFNQATPPQLLDPLIADAAITPPAPSSITQSIAIAPTSPPASSSGEASTGVPQRKKPRTVPCPKRILSKPNCPAVMATIPRSTPFSRKLRCDWREYSDLSDDFNEKWKRYMGYLCEVDGTLSADGSCERAKQLEDYFRDYREAQARVEKFEALAKKAPIDLRRMLEKKTPLEEVFHDLLEAREEPSNNSTKDEPMDVIVLSDSDSDPRSA